MTTKRFGSVLSNVTGTSKQLLRVNEAEDGFEFVSPPVLPTYTVTNDTQDRAINADDTTLDELADVLSTLIKDMATIYSGGPAAFTWSTSEQVYPFEKGLSGETLYCKMFSFAFNAGAWFSSAHGITSVVPYRLFGTLFSPIWGGASSLITIPNYILQDNLSVGCYSNDTVVAGYCGSGFSTGCTAKLFFIYAKGA